MQENWKVHLTIRENKHIWSGGLHFARLETTFLLTKSIISRFTSGHKHVAKRCDVHNYVCLTSRSNFQRRCGQELKAL